MHDGRLKPRYNLGHRPHVLPLTIHLPVRLDSRNPAKMLVLAARRNRLKFAKNGDTGPELLGKMNPDAISRDSLCSF